MHPAFSIFVNKITNYVMDTVKLIPPKGQTYNQRQITQSNRSEEDYITPEELKRRMKSRIKAIFKNNK
ncbi:hypothetical protein D0T66_04730 [Dysgonomonas sp. 25]|nr:hypothetical protein [Dysgonomonas sp. 25]